MYGWMERKLRVHTGELKIPVTIGTEQHERTRRLKTSQPRPIQGSIVSLASLIFLTRIQ